MAPIALQSRICNSLEWYPNSLHSHTLEEKNFQGDNYNPGGNKDVETLNGCYGPISWSWWLPSLNLKDLESWKGGRDLSASAYTRA